MTLANNLVEALYQTVFGVTRPSPDSSDVITQQPGVSLKTFTMQDLVGAMRKSTDPAAERARRYLQKLTSDYLVATSLNGGVINQQPGATVVLQPSLDNQYLRALQHIFNASFAAGVPASAEQELEALFQALEQARCQLKSASPELYEQAMQLSNGSDANSIATLAKQLGLQMPLGHSLAPSPRLLGGADNPNNIDSFGMTETGDFSNTINGQGEATPLLAQSNKEKTCCVGCSKIGVCCLQTSEVIRACMRHSVETRKRAFFTVVILLILWLAVTWGLLAYHLGYVAFKGIIGKTVAASEIPSCWSWWCHGQTMPGSVNCCNNFFASFFGKVVAGPAGGAAFSNSAPNIIPHIIIHAIGGVCTLAACIPCVEQVFCKCGDRKTKAAVGSGDNTLFSSFDNPQFGFSEGDDNRSDCSSESFEA
jgi:hypothetical protein